MKKILSAFAIFCMDSVFSMDQTSLVLWHSSGNQLSSFVRRESLSERETGIQKFQELTKIDKIKSVIDDGQRKGKDLKQLIEEGKLQVESRTIPFEPRIIDNSYIFLLLDNSVCPNDSVIGRLDRMDFIYCEELCFPLVREGLPEKYIVENIDAQNQTAKFVPLYNAVAKIDDKLLGVYYGGSPITSDRFVLEDEYFAYYEGTVEITDIDDAFCSKWLRLESQHKVAIKNREWKKAVVFGEMREKMKDQLINIAREKGLLRTSEDVSVKCSESEVKFENHQHQGEFEEGTKFVEATKDWKRVHKSKPDIPVIPTRWSMLEAMGASKPEIVDAIYKAAFGRMLNEFKLLVTPTLKRMRKEFVSVPATKSE